ncbi:MAG: hypothetical protein HQK96_06910 [Nitrospirae bacterium]|nr:hypothetical protein [Nitrospirota bacterium]
MEKIIESPKARVTESTLENIKSSIYGCMNCLWAGCECKNQSKFQAEKTVQGKATCKGFTYYD